MADKHEDSIDARVLRLEIYFKIAVGIAAIFGIGGGFGAYLMGSINSRITDAEKRVGAMTVTIDEKVSESMKELDKFRRTKEGELDKHAGDKLKELEAELRKLASDLESSPAASCRSMYQKRLEDHQELDNRDDVATVINYSVILYDTHRAVTPGKNWRFKAIEPGIYSVSAYAAFSLGGKVDEIREMTLTLFKNDSPDVYLAVTRPYRDGTMLGGTTEVCLEKDQYLDIRATPGGATTKPRIVTAGTDWIRIRYLRPLPPTSP